MPIVSPIDWPTMRDTLYEWVSMYSGETTVWADQKGKAPSNPFVLIKRITGLVTTFGVSSVRGFGRLESTQPLIVSVQVQSDTEATYSVQVNTSVFTYTVVGGDTIEDIRDELQTLISAGAEPVTVTDSGTDTLLIEADDADNPFTLILSTDLSGTITAGDYLLQHVGPKSFVFNVQAFADDVVTVDSLTILDRLVGSLELESVCETLSSVGLVVESIDGPTDISVLEDTAIESRATMDITFRVGACVSESFSTIGEVDVSKG